MPPGSDVPHNPHIPLSVAAALTQRQLAEKRQEFYGPPRQELRAAIATLQRTGLEAAARRSPAKKDS
jgi:hypothetical protein